MHQNNKRNKIILFNMGLRREMALDRTDWPSKLSEDGKLDVKQIGIFGIISFVTSFR